MIPDIAIIISAYAVARLLNSYVVDDEGLHAYRLALAVVAVAVIGFSLVDVFAKASEAGSLLP